MPGIELLYGPMLIGVFFNCMLFGVMVMQAFIYFQTYAQDSSPIRWFVIYLLVLEAVNTSCDIYLIYQPLVSEFGSLAAVTFFPSFLAASPIITVFISTPVQIFTAWRISIVSQSKKIAIVICFFALLSMVGGIWVGVQVVTFKFLARKASFQFNLPGVIWFVSSAVGDVLITGALVVSLSSRRTGHKKTDISINRIIRLTIQTGFTTMICALLDLLLFTISDKTAVSFVWDFSISKLYTNALLSTLNARMGWNNLNGTTDKDPENVLFGNESMRSINPQFKSFGTPVGGSTLHTGTTTATSNGAIPAFELQPVYQGRGSVKVVEKVTLRIP